MQFHSQKSTNQVPERGATIKFMITKKPYYKKHSEYLGKTIYKRLPGTGSHGGNWMTDSTTFISLQRAKAFLAYYYYKPTN